jgi:hypothetical protein
MNLFSPFGIVLSAKIMREKKTRQSKGYGFVLFRDEEAAAASVRGMNTAVIGNSRLQVRLAHPSASKDLQKQCRSIPQCQSMSTASLAPAPATVSTNATCSAPHGHAGPPLTGPTHRAAQPPTQHAHQPHYGPSLPMQAAYAAFAAGQTLPSTAAAVPSHAPNAGGGFMMPVVMLVGDEGGSFQFARTPSNAPLSNPSVFLPPAQMPYCRGWC